MRQIIRDERRVEMAMEGLRWYDIKRWKAGNEYLSGKVRGASFVDENKLDTRKFEEARDYLWAVPISEINVNPARSRMGRMVLFHTASVIPLVS